MISTLNAIVNTLCSTGVVDFPANYKITDKTHVYVFYIDGDEEVPEELLTQVTSFTGGADNEYKIDSISETGFNIELRDAYDTSDDRKISIRRIVPLTQLIDYPPGNDFPAATHERALDKLTAIIQQFEERIIRQIGVPLSEDASETSLLMPPYISNYYLGLDGDNNLIWKIGTVAVGNNEIKDSHIDWGIGANQVSAEDIPIEDSGSKYTAENIEAALQEITPADIILNTTHRTSDGSEHTLIDQDVKVAAGPTFNGGVQTDGTLIKTKVISIGDWDMDATPSVGVDHGLTLSTIINSKVMIMKDDSASLTPLDIAHSSYSNVPAGYAICNATQVAMSRITSGYYDWDGFDSTSFNRGFIVIQYTG